MVMFALVRILGNDLPPLHSASQTVENLRFLLQNESLLENCEKRFVLNRIADERCRRELEALLQSARVGFDVIPFEPDVYRALESPEKRLHYLTNINAARNRALEIGFARADNVLPFDGQIFVPASGWAQLRKAVEARPECPAFLVPMTRLLHNGEALQQERMQRSEEKGRASEPQILLARGCPDRFDETIVYGEAEKIELFVRLGVHGPWDQWQGERWTRIRAIPKSPSAGRAGTAGFVYRLASGNPIASLRPADRTAARQEGMRRLVERVDREMGAGG